MKNVLPVLAVVAFALPISSSAYFLEDVTLQPSTAAMVTVQPPKHEFVIINGVKYYRSLASTASAENFIANEEELYFELESSLNGITEFDFTSESLFEPNWPAWIGIPTWKQVK